MNKYCWSFMLNLLKQEIEAISVDKQFHILTADGKKEKWLLSQVVCKYWGYSLPLIGISKNTKDSMHWYKNALKHIISCVKCQVHI